ncbi:MAG: hypothetical protein ACYCSN_17540 [Acidobacteriaceae bacterium]
MMTWPQNWKLKSLKWGCIDVDAAAIVQTIQERGVSISLDNGRILVRPDSGLTDVHRTALRENRDAVAAYLAVSFTLTVDGLPTTLSGDKADALTRYDAAVLQTAKLPRDTVHTITLVDASGKMLRLAHFPPRQEVAPHAQENEARFALHRASATG